jgi:uncharacterized membrane protein required for colicin V production
VVSLTFVFWMYVVLFGVIGAMRGWARELLVSFSVILALTLITLLAKYIAFIGELMVTNPTFSFWLRAIIIIILVFFGYQTPNIPRFAAKMTREKLQDTLLGIFLGALNGYLIAGSIWRFMHEAGYPFAMISAPLAGTPMGDVALKLVEYLPPKLMGEPTIYFAVVLAFIFVIVVFI